MISLLIAASALLSADAPANLEAQLFVLAATQEKTHSAYARLSYDATRTISGFNQHLGRESTDVCRYEVIVLRALRNHEAVYTTDLNYWIDARDGLIRRSEFRPNGVESSLISRAAQYVDFSSGTGTLRVPLRIQRPAEGAASPESMRPYIIEYSNQVDEFDLPPLTLADMGLPAKGEVLRHWPIEGKPSQRLPWDGRDLTFRPGRRKE